MQTFRLAILDDDNYYRDTLVEILNQEKLFHVVYRFQLNGDLPEEIWTQEPDLIVVGINGPHETAMQIMQQVRSQRNCQQLPVLILSGSNDLNALCELLWTGEASGYITKDENPQIIIKALKALLLRNARPIVSTGLHRVQGASYLQPDIDFSSMRKLAGQELKIARMLLQNVDYAEISERCKISRSTTYTHIRNIKTKLSYQKYRQQVNLHRLLELYLEYYSLEKA